MGHLFQGFYTSVDSIRMNQVAISVINNNIANMNTEGYSKQRVEFEQGTMMPGSIDELITVSLGGVTLDAITRYENSFLENYYRQSNTELGYYDQMNTSLEFVENYFNELDGEGISGAMTDFYATAQEMAMDPTNRITRANFIQRAEDVAREFNTTYSNLSNYREDLVGNGVTTSSLESSQIYSTVQEINTKLEEVAYLNSQISALTTQQNVQPNSLLDKRTQLINQLSEYIPITLVQEGNNVELYTGKVQLIDGYEQMAKFDFDTAASTQDNPAVITIVDASGSLYQYVDDYHTEYPDSKGKLAAFLDIGGDGPESIYSYMQDLDLLAQEFARSVNDIQVRTDAGPPIMASMAMDGVTNQLHQATEYIFLNDPDTALFDPNLITASNIQINQAVISNPYEVATSYVETDAAFVPNDPNGIGNNDNAVAIADSRNTGIAALGGANVEHKMASMVSAIGSWASTTNSTYDSQKAAVDQVYEKKQQTVGVNLDEELMDLVKYQNAYNASARVFSAINEMMKIMMGLL